MGTHLTPQSFDSHPGIPLIDHVSGVIAGTHKRTSLPIAKLAAIFHDIGKINPHFQQKLKGEKPDGYSGHAYLSAFAWLCYIQEGKNKKQLQEVFSNDQLLPAIFSIATIVAHHHGNLPNLGESGIFSSNGYEKFLPLLDTYPNLPLSDYLQFFYPHTSFDYNLSQPHKLKIGKRIFLERNNTQPLQFFQDTQFAFASLIAADKIDASHYEQEPTLDIPTVQSFSQNYNQRLESYITKFKPTSELNKLRTKMRKESIETVNNKLQSTNERIFSLTAPTGAGKTIMLLSLAGQIIKQKGPHRIIYALPFLSITEQVEKECAEIFEETNIQRIDSKAQDQEMEEVLQQSDYNPDLIKKINKSKLAEKLFDYPFIITTFVRFFETLTSNHNATLLKLPNFSKAIFLIDEIQSLPPQLYGFFIALLEDFCRKFDAYAIISTATMPDFELPQITPRDYPAPQKVFKKYQPPQELLSLEYFQEKPFYRYEIKRNPNQLEIDDLSTLLLQEEKPALVILNTIQDTKDLFERLHSQKKCILLNTHFITIDRQKKIQQAKQLLNMWSSKQDEPFILISTQLIEAGVDIDFPVAYRDMAPVASIIQSAGRCNRNNNYPEKGILHLFELVKEGKPRSHWVYGQDSWQEFLNFPKRELHGTWKETDLLNIQKPFFEKLRNETIWGEYQLGKEKKNFLKEIQQANFENIGRFQLIDNEIFGDAFTFYIPTSQDTDFQTLVALSKELQEIPMNDWDKKALPNQKIKNLLKKMSARTLNANLKPNDLMPITTNETCCGLTPLDVAHYTFEKGLQLDNISTII